MAIDEVEGGHEVDIREIGRVLRRRAWVIALTAAVVVAAALALSVAQTPVYTATAVVLVPSEDAVTQASGNAVAQQNPLTLQRNVVNAKNYAESAVVKHAAEKALGYRATVTVSASDNADLLTFRARNTDPNRAAAIANSFAKAFIEQDRDRQVAQFINYAKTLNDQIQGLISQRADLPQDSTAYQQLSQQIASLQSTASTLQGAARISATTGGQVINPAEPPKRPSSPHTALNGLLAVLIGPVLGVGFAFVVDRLDDSVKSKQDLDLAAHGSTTLGLLPRQETWREAQESYLVSDDRPQSPAAESYRTLRTSLQILGIEQPLRVIGFTSPKAGEGKSTTAANLGVALARAGQRVVVLGCDFRRPRIQDFFDLSNDIGFTQVLLGEVSLTEALQTPANYPRLRVLASGPPPPNPSELLSLKRVNEVIEWLAGDADYVLVDCPPVLPVPDALQISQMVQGMVVVVAARRTGERELHRAVELLRQVDAPITGTVLNGFQHSGGYGYGYGYEYGYEYVYSSDESGRSGNGAGFLGRLHRRSRAVEGGNGVSARARVGAVEREAGD